MAEVTMSLEEYSRLIGMTEEFVPLSPAEIKKGQRSKPKRKGTPLKGMASALKKANAQARKKNGSFKKGWTQAKVMKRAHQIRRRGK